MRVSGRVAGQRRASEPPEDNTRGVAVPRPLGQTAVPLATMYVEASRYHLTREAVRDAHVGET